MHTIVRVEGSDGIGPFRRDYGVMQDAYYNPDHPLHDFTQRHQNFNTPHEDGIDIQSDMYCAFSSIEDFNKLYKPKELKLVILEGYKVLMIDVSEVIEGIRDQVCYKKKHIIQTKDISSLFI